MVALIHNDDVAVIGHQIVYDLLSIQTLDNHNIDQKRQKRAGRRMILKGVSFSCTFPAQRCKSLMLNGAGEGNRTLVEIRGKKW
jgi:hypothetical protein